MEEVTRDRSSRRALLAAAAGAAGALAAGAALPATMLAEDPNDVVKGVDNPTDATTSITDSGADSTAFAANATGTGAGFGAVGTSIGAAGVHGWSVSAPDWDPPFAADVTTYTGVFGSAPGAPDGSGYVGTGVWGDSPDFGVYGGGSIGVQGDGGWGVVGWTNGDPGGIGVYAISPNTTAYALRVQGKVKLSRSGRKSVGAGKSSIAIGLAGTTSSSKVFAVLATSEPGRWVRAVVPASGKFTVYFNTRLASKATIAWFVLD